MRIAFITFIVLQAGDFITTFLFRHSPVLTEGNPLLSSGLHPVMWKVLCAKLIGIGIFRIGIKRIQTAWLVDIAYFLIVGWNIYCLTKY